jgi:hypothetical protein
MSVTSRKTAYAGLFSEIKIKRQAQQQASERRVGLDRFLDERADQEKERNEKEDHRRHGITKRPVGPRHLLPRAPQLNDAHSDQNHEYRIHENEVSDDIGEGSPEKQQKNRPAGLKQDGIGRSSEAPEAV